MHPDQLPAIADLLVREPYGPDVDLSRIRSTNSKLDHLEGEAIVLSSEKRSRQLAPPDENEKILSERVCVDGLDVLAFYKSFRFIHRQPCPGIWGIFILDAGVNLLGNLIASALPDDIRDRTPDAVIISCAEKILLHHEYFHFLVDRWTLAQELSNLTYPPNDSSTPDGGPADVPTVIAPVKRYEYYILNGDRLSHGFEERLATTFALNQVPAALRDASSVALRLLQQDILSEDVVNRRLGIISASINSSWRGPNHSLGGYCCLAHDNLQGIADLNGIGGCFSANAIEFDGVVEDGPPRHRVQLVDPSSLCSLFAVSLKETKLFVCSHLNGVLDHHSDHDYYRIDNGELIKMPNPHSKDLKRHEKDNILSLAGYTPSTFEKARNRTKKWTRDCPRDPVLKSLRRGGSEKR